MLNRNIYIQFSISCKNIVILSIICHQSIIETEYDKIYQKTIALLFFRLIESNKMLDKYIRGSIM